MAEVGEEVGTFPDGEAEEGSGGGSHGLGIKGGGSFSKDDAGASEGGGIADDGAEVSGVGDFRKNDEGVGAEVGKGGGFFWLTGDGEVAAVEVEAEEGGGLGAGEIGADDDDFFDLVG